MGKQSWIQYAISFRGTLNLTIGLTVPHFHADSHLLDRLAHKPVRNSYFKYEAEKKMSPIAQVTQFTNEAYRHHPVKHA